MEETIFASSKEHLKRDFTNGGEEEQEETLASLSYRKPKNGDIENDDESSQQVHEAAETLLEIKKQCESDGHINECSTPNELENSRNNQEEDSISSGNHVRDQFVQSRLRDDGQQSDDEEDNILRQLQNNDESENEGNRVSVFWVESVVN